MVKKLELTDGSFALIDSRDSTKASKYIWGRGYGGQKKYIGTNLKSGGQMLLHRFIMNTPKGFHTDHINGDVTDNRRINLRICTPAQNQFNSRKYVKKSSGYKGVCWYKRDSCWRAYININRRQIHLGYFALEKEAAKRYNQEAIQLFGEYAFLNKP